MGKDQVQISVDHVMTQVNIYFSNFDGAWMSINGYCDEYASVSICFPKAAHFF